MNIILKGFNIDCGGKPMMEEALRGLKIGTCISILEEPIVPPEIDAWEHIALPARQQRAGEYPNIKWTDMTPLDEELIDSMRHCEAVFMKMIGRYAIYKDIPYDERKRQYYRHLRYWNHVLNTKKIDLFLSHSAPHQCYDLVIYDLCKLKGIRTLYMAMFFDFDAFNIEEDWQETGKDIGLRMTELQKEYSDQNTHVPLSDEYDGYFSMFTQEQRKPWYMSPSNQRLLRHSFIAKWIKVAFVVLFHKPIYLLKSVTSTEFWRRKWSHHTTRKLYDKLAEVPDLNVPYIYLPLHMQPEATTCPMGGAYVDQELIVQLLSACIPEGVKIYVKEHPNQEELWRDREFYQAMQEIPSVQFVPRSFSTYDLINNSVAVAAATGTACLQGLFKEKPAFMFGHKYFQYAPGVHRIRSIEDCKLAVQKVFHDKKRHTARDMRIFLKAIEETTGMSFARASAVRKPIPKEERAGKMGEYIRKKILKEA